MLTTEDVVTTDTVQSIVTAKTQANFGFRQLFRDHNGSGAGQTMRFPLKEQDFQGAIEEVEEGAEYPKYDVEYGDVEAVYTKYGFETDITDEALEDGVLDIRMDQTEDMIREEARRLNGIAAGVTQGNFENTYGDDGGSLGFETVIDARAQFLKYDSENEEAGYTPDLLLVEPLGAASIIKSDAFQLRDTPVGDRAVTDGFIGSVAGMDIFEDNSGNIEDYNAFMADTMRYGYESAKARGEVTSRREESQDKTVYKLRDRLDWVATDPGAVAKVEG